MIGRQPVEQVRLLPAHQLKAQAPAGHRWTYVGGAVDPAASTVRVRLPGFSRYAVMAYERSFADLSAHWARSDMEVLVSRYLANGVSPEEFQPDRQITRAELAKLLVSMLASVPAAGVKVESRPTPHLHRYRH